MHVRKSKSPAGETTVEARIVRVFLRSVGAELGFYNAGFKEFRAGVESEPVYQSNLEIVRSALKQGWVAADLEEFIISRYRAGERQALLSEILPKQPENKRLDESDNLLEDEEPHFHPQLFVRRMPSFTVTGGVMVPVTRGTVTPKEVFTLLDLVSYFFQHGRQGDTPRQRSAAINQMRWLLSQATVDEILFAIDLAEESGKDVGVFDLTDFLDVAREQVLVCEARSTE
jgi:hypothetical protein